MIILGGAIFLIVFGTILYIIFGQDFKELLASPENENTDENTDKPSEKKDQVK